MTEFNIISKFQKADDLAIDAVKIGQARRQAKASHSEEAGNVFNGWLLNWMPQLNFAASFFLLTFKPSFERSHCQAIDIPAVDKKN